MDKPRPDYIGVHLPQYRSIQAGNRDGWSSAEEVQDALSAVQTALALAEAPWQGCWL